MTTKQSTSLTGSMDEDSRSHTNLRFRYPLSCTLSLLQIGPTLNFEEDEVFVLLSSDLLLGKLLWLAGI